MRNALSLQIATAARGHNPSGEVQFITPGTYNWVVPDGVYSVSVVAVGSGIGSVPAGNSYFNTLIAAGSNGRSPGNPSGHQGGSSGGLGGLGTVWHVDGYADDYIGGGGGGAAGYLGVGGNGGKATNTGTRDGHGGGGVGLFGLGDDGKGGTSTNTNPTSKGGDPMPGSGGGGGGAGGNADRNPSPGIGGSNGDDGNGRIGGLYGAGYGGVRSAAGTGGGALAWRNDIAVTPGQVIPIKVGTGGAVRIIWPGNLRQFPSTRTLDE